MTNQNSAALYGYPLKRFASPPTFAVDAYFKISLSFATMDPKGSECVLACHNSHTATFRLLAAQHVVCFYLPSLTPSLTGNNSLSCCH